ncbi:MAG: amidohydrolase [Burkholderiales bacterium]|nr:amidohydrolase [Burkholderiales bacterium]
MSKHPCADLVLHNAKVATLDADDRFARAVAVWKGRILAVGDDEDMLALAGAGTRRVDCGGRTLVPGIIDSHCHPDHHAIKLQMWEDFGFPTVRSVEDTLSLVRRLHQRLPTGQFIRGFGYNDKKCGRYPTREELDAAAPDRPVYIGRTDGHIAVVNSALLAHFGITDETPDPPHGEYLRDPGSGRMTGVLREWACWNIDAEFKNAYTPDDYAEGLCKVFDLFLEQGVTSLHNSLTQGKAITAYQQLRESARLRMRIGIILDGRDMPMVDSWIAAGVRTGFGDEWLRVQGVEWCPDCSTSGRTAAYYKPYVGTPIPGEPQPNTGMLLYEADELYPLIARVHAAGLRVCVEGLGDRGIDFALDGIEAALAAHPRADHRSRVEHCCCVTPEIVARLKRLEVIDSSATGFMYSLGDAYIDNRGEAEMDFMWPHRALVDAGVRAAGHSDAPICGVNPWEIMGAMVTRTTDSGRPIGASQKVTPTEALRAYTTEGAWIGFEEHIKGSIEASKLADLALLDRDIFTIDPAAIAGTRVDMTVLDGVVVHER